MEGPRFFIAGALAGVAITVAAVIAVIGFTS